MDWSDSWRSAFRIELRAEAIGLASRGWQVLPGTYPTASDDQDDVSTGGVGPVPVHADWSERIGASAEQVAAWWSGEPRSLLAATGSVLDAVEVDDELGRRTATVLREHGGPAPIVATPSGRWMFLVQSGHPLAELAGRSDVTVHAAESWIPLPPSPFGHGIAHWRVKPEVCGWRLPAARIVQDAILRALGKSAVPAETRQNFALAGAEAA